VYWPCNGKRSIINGRCDISPFPLFLFFSFFFSLSSPSRFFLRERITTLREEKEENRLSPPDMGGVARRGCEIDGFVIAQR